MVAAPGGVTYADIDGDMATSETRTKLNAATKQCHKL